MKIALVTGASRGLGKGFADFLSKNGFIVYAGVRNLDSSTGTKQSNVRPIRLDVLDDLSIKEALEQINREVDRLDFLINNAGSNKDTATDNHKDLVTELRSLDRQYLLKMFNLNSVSPLMIIKQALPLMKECGFIINISSERASFKEVRDDNNANYGYKASKVALNMLTAALLFDLPENVSVITVAPGSVRSRMNPTGAQEPAEAAEKIYKIVQNWDDKLNGKFLNYDGQLYPL